jgi:hypothetical protein
MMQWASENVQNLHWAAGSLFTTSDFTCAREEIAGWIYLENTQEYKIENFTFLTWHDNLQST